MLFNQRCPQPGKTPLRVRRNHQLVRIGAPFRGDRNRFATPDQFCSTAAKTPPAPHGALARIPVDRPVPAFHRLNSDPISNRDSRSFDRASQGRIFPADELAITRDRHPKRRQMFLKSSNVLQSTDSKNGVRPHLEFELFSER